MLTQAERDYWEKEDAAREKMDRRSLMHEMFEAGRRRVRVETINHLERLLRQPESNPEALYRGSMAELDLLSACYMEMVRRLVPPNISMIPVESESISDTGKHSAPLNYVVSSVE